MAVLYIRNSADDGWIPVGITYGNIIQDADGDTKVQCEESADEDIIRFDCAGSEVLQMSASAISGSLIKDEDNMASDSASHLATQQSIKAYADTKGVVHYGQTALSGTSVTLASSLPAGIIAIDIIFKGVSTNTSSQPPIIQLGDSGGFETSGYLSYVCTQAAREDDTDGFYLHSQANWATGDITYGTMQIRRYNDAAHTWCFTSISQSTTETSTRIAAGEKTLSGELTQIRVKTPGGSATFDAGYCAVIYWLG